MPENTPESAIRLHAVTRTFGRRDQTLQAIEALSWVSGPHRFWVVAGSSGSGKTTLLQLIGGIERPTAGEIWVNGSALHTMKEPQLADFRRHRIGFVFQGSNLLRHLTVYENIELPLLMTRGRGDESGIRRQLDMVGLADRADAYPADLSGGEQQRVAVARALIHRPCLVLADEPTANLDSTTGLALFELLQRLQSDQGVTVVLATHDPLLIERAPALVRLVDGCIVDVRPGPNA